jgi:tRNA 5-methylaminomethyl-2-thiouridine biosynthesis bifunctional protein
MPRLPPAADVTASADGTLLAAGFDDTYFSRDGGLDETRAVFLAGCGLPQRFAGRPCFTIAELGFGSGLNFLATWDLWRQAREPGAVLHFVSVEGFPLAREQAALSHAAALPQLTDLSSQLLARWPVRAYGVQRLWFEGGQLALTLVIGPVQEALPRLAFAADAWFLDGFAPARNPDMWSDEVLRQVARLSAPGARAATYSVAGPVRRGLEAAGFQLARAPGFGRKRERLEAWLPETGEARTAPQARPTSLLVIGGGIAGAAMAVEAQRRGLAVTVLDADPCGRTKASGNPRGIVLPRLDLAETREARFYRAAFIRAVDELSQLGGVAFEPTGGIELAKPGRAGDAHRRLLDDPPLPPDWLAAGETGTLHHRRGGVVAPADLVRQLMDRLRAGAGAGMAPASIVPGAVARLVRDGHQWCALDGCGAELARADLCVVAAGPDSARLIPQPQPLLPLEGRLGVLSVAPLRDGAAPPPVPLTGGAYAGAMGTQLFHGATFDPWPADQPPRLPQPDDHARNKALLAAERPDLADQIDTAGVWGRAAVRATTPDRLPVAGPVPGHPGLSVLSGLGSRGLTTAFLCADLVAARVLNEPLPVETDLVAALDPARFARRAARRAPAPRTGHEDQ